ncbi:MAG: PKD domain-containing protein, partial [Bacteroidales bacterium]|nr:PKD domain-containing protein [Bacteroidales bacterium]
SSVNDWCGNGVGSTCYDINLSQWVGNKSVKVKFESYCSYGNNLFIDDINIEADAYDLSADFIASDTIICAGESIDFIDMSSGLVNTWAWEFEGGTPTISNQQNPTSIIYNVPGVYDVKLIIGNGVNTDTIIKSDYITVNSLPQITTSNDTIICSGECVTLSASGGISYLWSTGNLTYYINVCPTTNTTYSVTITDNNGCTNSDEIAVIVNDNPGAYISGTKTICEGVCTDLLALPPAGVTYSWSTGESSNPINVCPTDSTIYTVTVTDNNGCTGSYDAAVNVNPVPLVDAGADKTITQGHSTTLTATTTGGQGPTYAYVWSTGDQTAQISVFPSSTTTYTVTVTDMNGCTDSDDVHVQVNAQIPSIITRVEPLPGLYCPGDPVVVQISATNVYNVGSFSLVLNYDTAVLSYQGYTANPGLAVGILLVNNVASLEQVRMTCFTIFTPINIGNDILLEYSFIHKGSSCDLTWNTPVQGDCEYNDASPQQLPLPSAFINGNITGSSGPQASAGSDKSVYQGSCTLLTASGGGTYAWSNGDQIANTVVCPPVTSTYTVTVTDGNGCTASDDVIVTVNSIPTTNVELQGKVILQGAYAGSGIMNTLICQTDSFPHSQPFNTSPWNYTGMEQISSVPANVVDWVLIEIRDSNDVNIVHEYRAGLLLNNGQIIDTNFTTGINLTTISSAYYYVVIRHLNHLPLMTANPVMLPNTVVLDFSDTTNTPLYGGAKNSAIEVESNVFAMIGGDINSDGTLKYSGPGNDRGLILQKIINESGSTIITTILTGYYQEDITLDGKLKYSGPANDPSLIIQNLVNLTGSTSITVIFTTPVPNP